MQKQTAEKRTLAARRQIALREYAVRFSVSAAGALTGGLGLSDDSAGEGAGGT